MVATSALDERFMRRALFHAARGAGRTSPNPMVGAVVVSADGVVVGQGYHERAGGPHAEAHAIAAAGERARNATLYVNLEPCCHIGRTGPCTRVIVEAGVTRVVAAMRDPDPRVSGRGFEELRAGGVRVDVGVCQDEALRLNRAFVINKTLGRPMVILKAATSLDACVAAARGARTKLSCREADQRTHLLRATIDAIAVGSETVLVDDPLLTARGAYRERPLVRVVFDRRLRTPVNASLFSTLQHGPLWIVTSFDAPRDNRAALENAGAQIIPAGSLAESLAELAQRGVMTLLVEGGPSLHASFVAQGLFDRVQLVVTPHVVGPQGVRWLDVQTLELPYGAIAAEQRGVDTWIEADVHRNH